MTPLVPAILRRCMFEADQPGIRTPQYFSGLTGSTRYPRPQVVCYLFPPCRLAAFPRAQNPLSDDVPGADACRIPSVAP